MEQNKVKSLKAQMLEARKRSMNLFSDIGHRLESVVVKNGVEWINDSKATSFSSSVSILKSMSNVYWIVGGLAKKKDKFLLSKNNCKSFKAYIFGKKKNPFIKELKKVIEYESFTNLKTLIKKVFIDVKINKNKNHQTILFSPAAASFDFFKNFEKRGEYFNSLIKEHGYVNR